MTTPSTNDGWLPCETGLISSRLKEVDRRRRRRDLVRYGAASAGLAILAGGVAQLFPAGEAVLSCMDVKERAVDYVAGRLDESWRRGIETHLKKCRSCTLMIARMRSQENSTEAPPRL
jgi:hypothetical protein